MSKGLQIAGKPVIAAAVYAAFAVYLYQPHWRNFQRWEYLLLVNSPVAAMGCYVLSRRWVSSFVGSFFAGAVCGFGPFMLGLARFHPTAGFLAAAVPWLFCPAVFISRTKWSVKAAALSVLPFAAILVFFQVSLHYHLFAVPKQAKLHLADLFALAAPLVAVRRGLVPVGFYHIPLAPLIMGFSMLIAARRIGVMMILAVAIVLGFCNSLFGVSPIMWFTVVVSCCSVLIGAGTQGLISAGFADRKWILAATITMAALAIATLLLATKYFQTFFALVQDTPLFLPGPAECYSLGAIVLLVLFFLLQAGFRAAAVRAVLLSLAMGVDMFLGARFIVDMLF